MLACDATCVSHGKYSFNNYEYDDDDNNNNNMKGYYYYCCCVYIAPNPANLLQVINTVAEYCIVLIFSTTKQSRK